MWLCRTIARSPIVSGPAGPVPDLVPPPLSGWSPKSAPPPGRGGSDSRMANGEEIQCSVEILFFQTEVRARDRGGEAVVEGLGQPQVLMDAVPAELDRQLVRAQLAGVKEAEHLDPAEVGLAELPELVGSILLHVPGVVRLLGAGGRQRQQVGGRDEGDAAGREHRLEVLEDRARILDVLDRLQEDDGVAGLAERLDQ